MSCKVKTILAPDGKPSKVFNNISSVYGAEVVLAAYLYMHSDEFKVKHSDVVKTTNGEPDWRMVLDALNDSSNTVNNVIEKSIGVRRATNSLLEYESDDANA